MGEVHLAEDSSRGRLVALKFSSFVHHHDRNPVGVLRFRREALVASTFDHPGLCTVYDAGEVDGVSFLAMEYVEGDPLSSFIRSGPGLPDERLAVSLVHEVAVAVAVAHSRGVIHRDLKPSNIIIRTDGRPVVIDFGLSGWFVEGETRLTKTGTIMGTPYYMSPEQVNGDVRAMGPGCDIYSLGVVLYELLTGRLPFEGTLASVLGKILFYEPTPPSTHRQDLDPRLEAICDTAMSKEISARFRSMDEMAAVLGSILGESGETPGTLNGHRSRPG